MSYYSVFYSRPLRPHLSVTVNIPSRTVLSRVKPPKREAEQATPISEN
jgi:hypothetical protein